MRVVCFFGLIVMLGLFSCSENNKPSGANNIQVEKTFTNPSAEAEFQAGRSLFVSNCASCHMITNNLTGPALQGVEDRWANKQLLYEFIKNANKVIAKDAYAKALYNQYNKVEMNHFAWMTDEQISLILKYVKADAARK